MGHGYGTGVAVGDFNNDGLPDLYVTGLGRNSLYRNNGDGTFTDITDRAGVAGSGGP
jgi:enediyne biosynthesis protein E4